MKIISIKDFDNIRIGNAQNTSAGTGCTVIISENGMCAGLDVRGGGPASRESELLKPLAAADRIHAVLLGGGSAFGLDAAGGVMQFLEEKGIGLDVGIAKVPLVCQSDIFDLTVADPYTRPDKAMGYEACVGAWQNNYQDGCFGVGTGATIGKLNGMEHCMKSGIGSYAVQIGELKIGAIVAVNALGDIYDHHNGQIIAGMLSDRFFPRNRSVMAGFISLLNTAGFALMLWSPHNYYTDILAMIVFGATIGALTCFLGGLIAVDISSRKAAGAALGTIGIASYAGAGLGEFLTGIIIDKTAILENGKTLYDFSTLALFWIGTGLGSALLCFTTAAIVARRHAVERQTSFSS